MNLVLQCSGRTNRSFSRDGGGGGGWVDDCHASP